MAKKLLATIEVLFVGGLGIAVVSGTQAAYAGGSIELISLMIATIGFIILSMRSCRLARYYLTCFPIP